VWRCARGAADAWRAASPLSVVRALAAAAPLPLFEACAWLALGLAAPFAVAAAAARAQLPPAAFAGAAACACLPPSAGTGELRHTRLLWRRLAAGLGGGGARGQPTPKAVTPAVRAVPRSAGRSASTGAGAGAAEPWPARHRRLARACCGGELGAAWRGVAAAALFALLAPALLAACLRAALANGAGAGDGDGGAGARAWGGAVDAGRSTALLLLAVPLPLALPLAVSATYRALGVAEASAREPHPRARACVRESGAQVWARAQAPC
jgi:hypothetical protein